MTSSSQRHSSNIKTNKDESLRVSERPCNTFQLYIQTRRLMDVQKGISIARHRVTRFTQEAALQMVKMEPAVGSLNQRSQLVYNPLTIGRIGKQLGSFYGDDERAPPGGAEPRTASRKNQRIAMSTTNRNRDKSHVSTNARPSSAERNKTDTLTHTPVRHHQVTLPPLVSPMTCLQDGADQQSVVNFDAYLSDVDVADVPPVVVQTSPEVRRVSLLARPRHRVHRKPSAAEADSNDDAGLGSIVKATVPVGSNGYPNRTLPLCPTSNCRLISLSWDGHSFMDDHHGTANISGGRTLGPTADFQNYGFPKRRPIVAARTRQLERFNGAYSSIGDELITGDVTGNRRRRCWTDVGNETARSDAFGEYTWNRESTGLLIEQAWNRKSTGLLIEQVSLLINASKESRK